VVSRSRILIRIDPQRLAPALGHLHRDDFGREARTTHGQAGAALAFRRECVLVGPRHLVPGRDFFGRDAHVDGVDRARQAVAQQRVGHLAVAHPVAPAGSLQDVGGIGHRLRATGHNGIDEADPEGLGRVHDRLEA
jgi:hypothetical protein